MPTLNSEAYLGPRLASIRSQTLTDWELVVVDSQSDDQTLAMIEAFAAEGGAVRVHQGPRDGIYTNINRSIEYARGQYIYIATSDDTMADDCLEKLVEGLESHPDCGLAHCRLLQIDASGKPAAPEWWSVYSSFARSSEGLLDTTHRRLAPFDGMLHMLGESLYTSLTQLLIRRSLLDQIGMFDSTWGSIGDFNWGMRAALVSNTVHVAGTWGGWRLHEAQATAQTQRAATNTHDRFDDMIRDALERSMGGLPSGLTDAMSSRWIGEVAEMRRFIRFYRAGNSGAARARFLGGRLLAGSSLARRVVAEKLRGGRPLLESLPDQVRGLLESETGAPVLVPVGVCGD